MTKKILYTCQDLLNLTDTTIIDIRSPESYQQGHIPGAVNIPEVFNYLLADSSQLTLAEMAATFATFFANAGVCSDRPSIFYEDHLTSQYGGACRGYWLLSYLGHPLAGVLAGGFDNWQEAGLAIAKTAPPQTTGNFFATPDPTMIAVTEDVLASINSPSVVLLDNRDEPEWRGYSSSPYGIDFAPRKGKIPGARWIEWYRFMDNANCPAFKSPAAIRALCAEHHITPNDDIIIYCFKGARAAHTYVALQLAGFQHLRVYFGSWNEWSRHPALPIS